MKMLSGMMSGPTITSVEVDAERRTVSAEAREQDGAQVRISDAASKLFYAGQPLADRSPIGNLDSLAKASSETLRGFHDRWYRPDNTVIAMSGDGDPVVFAQLIAKYFSDWKPVAAGPVPAVDLGRPSSTGQTTSFIFEAGLPTSVNLAWLRPWTQVDDTIALNQGRLIEIVASRLINRRLEQRARAGGSFLQADVEQENVARSTDATFVSIIPLGEDWRLALGDVRAVIADALVNMPTQAEIDREANEFTALLDVQVETARAEASAKQADDLVEAVNIRETVASPEVARDVFGALKDKIRPADVLKATQRLFSGIGPRAFVSSQTDQSDGATQLAAAIAAPVTALTTDRDSCLLYTSDAADDDMPV
jgi:zinc protease